MVALYNDGEKMVVKRGRPPAAERNSSPSGNEGALGADAHELKMRTSSSGGKQRRSFSQTFQSGNMDSTSAFQICKLKLTTMQS